jgi:ferritin-like metal-binding protein YciE
MPPHSVEEQLIKYLTDAHSIECQALVQMRIVPRIASDTEIASHFSEHLHETEEHERLVRERLEATGADRSLIKDAVGAVSGSGFALFAMAQPDTPGKLVAHAFAYEHMELAAYELLSRVAQRAGDEKTAAMAVEILEQERAAASGMHSLLEEALDASLHEQGVGVR